MEDVNKRGYQLMSDQLIKGKLLKTSAEKIAISLAELAKEARRWEKFKTNESAEQSIYERGLELRLAYPNTQEEYLFLENQYISNNQFWLWPDGHPKNIFINESGEVLFIDFGRSHWADQRYMLPNFLAHIIIYSLTGFYSKMEAVSYIERCITTFRSFEEIDQKLFCQFLAMEVLHRAYGKWISGVTKSEQKLRLLTFSLKVFDEKIDRLEKLFVLLNGM